MAKFKSDISRFKSVVADDTDIRRRRGMRGYEERDLGQDGVCASPYASPLDMPIYTSEELIEVIEERERKKETNFDRLQAMGLTPKHQGRTNSCWSDCVAFGAEYQKAFETGKVVRLSSASLAGPLKNFRNWRGNPAGVGGWCSEALNGAVELGWSEVEYWPNTDLNPRNKNAESDASRKKHKPIEWFDLTPRSYLQGATVAAKNFLVPAAFNWMRHAVTIVDPLYFGRGEFGFLCANSGYLRDTNGWTVLKGKRAIPDEQVAIRSMT